MRGEVLKFDDMSGSGLISGDDGVRYSFDQDAASSASAIVAGMRVDFIPVGDAATNVMVLAAASIGPAPLTSSGYVGGYDFKTALFSFDGRLRRQHFWISWLICLGVGVVAGWIPLIGVLISLALIWPNLAITVKRLHDMGQSGWLAAIPFAAGVIGAVAILATVGSAMVASGGNMDSEDPAAVWALIGPSFGIIALIVLVQLCFLLWIGIAEGQRGDNHFGPNPKGDL